LCELWAKVAGGNVEEEAGAGTETETGAGAGYRIWSFLPAMAAGRES